MAVWDMGAGASRVICTEVFQHEWLVNMVVAASTAPNRIELLIRVVPTTQRLPFRLLDTLFTQHSIVRRK